MQNFGETNKEHYGMLWYFWSGQLFLLLENENKNHNHTNEQKCLKFTKKFLTHAKISLMLIKYFRFLS